MSPMLLSFISGFLGGVCAFVILAAWVWRSVRKSDALIISRGPNPVVSEKIVVLQFEWQPCGLRVRFRNTGERPLETIRFSVRGYKDGRLWAEFESDVVREVPPGAEDEALLKLWKDGFPVDLVGCRIEMGRVFGIEAAPQA